MDLPAISLMSLGEGSCMRATRVHVKTVFGDLNNAPKDDHYFSIEYLCSSWLKHMTE